MKGIHGGNGVVWNDWDSEGVPSMAAMQRCIKELLAVLTPEEVELYKRNSRRKGAADVAARFGRCTVGVHGGHSRDRASQG